MSAYAMGCLFLPEPVSDQANTPKASNKSPLHEQRGCESGKITRSPSSLSNLSSQHEETASKEVGIAVKEAKLDPVRLVQSLSTSSTQSETRRKRHNDSSREGPPETPTKRKTSDMCEDAIQFELSIKFNGRTYSATRTLPRIIQLRSELIRERHSRRKSLQNRRQEHKSLYDSNGSDDDETVSTVDELEEEDLEQLIPELPDCGTEAGSVHGGGFVGRGFTLLQALLRSYCPAMERWLRNVADIVPPNSSPSLQNFLWEPVLADSSGERVGKIRTSSSLGCIMEDEGVDEDEEEVADSNLLKETIEAASTT